MKKVFAFLTAILLFCSLAACSAGASTPTEDPSASEEARVLGKWEFQSVGVAMIFNEDHTGRMMSLSDESDGGDFRWSYDATADVYPIYMDGKAYVYYAQLDTEGNLVYYGETATKAE